MRRRAYFKCRLATPSDCRRLIALDDFWALACQRAGAAERVTTITIECESVRQLKMLPSAQPRRLPPPPPGRPGDTRALMISSLLGPLELIASLADRSARGPATEFVTAAV